MEKLVEDFGLVLFAGAAAFIQEAFGYLLAKLVQFNGRGVVLRKAEFEGKRAYQVLHEAVDGLDREVLVLVQDLAEFHPGLCLQSCLDGIGLLWLLLVLSPLMAAEQFFPVGIPSLCYLGKGLKYLALHVGRGGVGEGDSQNPGNRGTGFEQMAHVFLGQGVGLAASGGSFIDEQPVVGLGMVCVEVVHGSGRFVGCPKCFPCLSAKLS